MKLNENIMRGQELLELGKKLIYGNEEDNALAVIAGTVIVEKAAKYLRAEYIKEATALAMGILEKDKKTSGSFKQNGISYSISKSVVYDFIGNPQKYHDAEISRRGQHIVSRELLQERRIESGCYRMHQVDGQR